MIRNRWIDQTILANDDPDSHGNCTEAAVASILGIPLSEVPDFRRNGADAWSFWRTVERFFDERGWALFLVQASFAPPCLHLAAGPSERGHMHMVVVRDEDELVHDPHPSRAGLIRVDFRWLVLPKDPAEVVS